MALEVDQEILQDFLVEAGEILEQLSEQLVELEMRPKDADLLNAIFRGFHTVKGGAGFLSLTNLVDVCHVSENVFDILRKGQRQVEPELMDVVLRALDQVNSMFDQVRANEEPTPADSQLLAQLEELAQPAAEGTVPVASAEIPSVAPPPAPVVVPPPVATPFASPSPVATAEPPAATEEAKEGEITESEFEDLLDKLHGRGHAPGVGHTQSAEASPGPTIIITPPEPVVSPAPVLRPTAAPVQAVTAAAEPAAAKPEKIGGGDEISEDEFESLLDSLHGKGLAPGQAAATPGPAQSTPTIASITPKPAPVVPAAKPATPVTPASVKPVPVPPKPASTPAKSPSPFSAASSANRRDEDAEDKAPHKEKVGAGNKGDQQATQMAETTVRVDTSRLDDIMNMVGELVLVRNRLVTLGATMHDENMVQAVANLDVVTADLQMAVMKTRMQPIKKVFGRFPRVVRDLARSLKKDIVLELIGEETDLDKNLVEALADPLVHLVRNSVDHGIELPADRERKGKTRTGTVILSAEQAGDHILLSIQDDGAGMDPEKLRNIAVSKGLMDKDVADRLSEKECFNLIFMPGFSTKQEISDISGRGVGMDVVKTKITQLNGSVDIESVKDIGTTLRIKVPLTLAILPTLMVVLGEQTFALPLTSVNEIFHLDLTKTNTVDGQLTVIVREKALPLFYLKHWLVEDSDKQKSLKEGHVVIVSIGTQRIGFVVDQLVGQEEVVIKPLGSMLHGTPGMAGATITGDGRIAMILDIPSLLGHYARRN